MRKRWLALVLVTLTALAGCGAKDDGDALANTVAAQNGSVHISVPEGWAEDTSYELHDTLVLVVGNGADTWAQVNYYPDDGNGYSAKDFLDMASENHFGNYIVDKAAELKLGDNAAAYFGYSMAGKDADGNDCTYRGYEYFVSFGANVAEVDIFCRYTDTAPTSEQQELMRSIAESIQPGA